jgi:hypothetical protein
MKNKKNEKTKKTPPSCTAPEKIKNKKQKTKNE